MTVVGINGYHRKRSDSIRMALERDTVVVFPLTWVLVHPMSGIESAPWEERRRSGGTTSGIPYCPEGIRRDIRPSSV